MAFRFAPFSFSVALFWALCWCGGNSHVLLDSFSLWRADDSLNAIEPAEGAETAPEKSSEHGESATKEGEGGHEGAKSSSGKELTKAPGLPRLLIAGTPVQTKAEISAQMYENSLPESLKKPPSLRGLLERRMTITTFAHDPSIGPLVAPLLVLEFTDLACLQCLDSMKTMDALLKPISDKTRFVSLAMTGGPDVGTNMPAFYAKIAQQSGHFWDYRKAVIDIATPSPDAYFQALLDSGVDRFEARRLMTTDARRFYRELDADNRLAKSLGLDAPVHYYLNGVHLGAGGIPLDKMADVMTFEQKRLDLLATEHANE